MNIVWATAITLALVGASSGIPQTNASKASPVGTWKLDLTQSTFGSEPAPKSLTLTILKDTPQLFSWRVDVVDAKGVAFSYSWSGPTDGSMQPVTGPKGEAMGKQGLK